jgi:hypothetical protein
MLELPMAAAGRDQIPAIVEKEPQDLADFHEASISAWADADKMR